MTLADKLEAQAKKFDRVASEALTLVPGKERQASYLEASDARDLLNEAARQLRGVA